MNISGKVLLAGTVVATIATGCSQDQSQAVDQQTQDKARPAKIVSLSQQDASLLRTYPGTLEAFEKADLAFRVSGQLMELPARAGLRVKAGDLLAKLDPTDYQNKVNELQARYDLASTQLQQARELLKKNLSSQLRYDQANAELKSAQASLKQARDNLRYATLNAPFEGMVARVDIENYQPVKAQQTVIHLRREDPLVIRFSVPETLMARLKQVKDISVLKQFCGKVRFATHPMKTFKACYKEHETVPDPLSRNYSGAFTLDPIKDFVALPGMTAKIELDFSDYLADSEDSVVFAPVEAVFSDNGKQWLWLVGKDMKVVRQEVTTGRIEGDRIEITSDIDAGSHVIAAGVSRVREGMLVKPVIKQRGL